MKKINVLPKQIAELIAAGEVVDRPASVVKELVENAVDAGSSFITIEIKQGGVQYIRVTDNGSGIAREDVRDAFIRNATSKIRTEADLASIGTLGFRGEALASVAAMARVELLTRTQKELAGTHYAIEGGVEQRLEDAGCPVGTTIVVRDLFYNTPARMKFLKTNQAEGNAVSVVLDKLALSHPEVSFRYIREGKEELFTQGDCQVISAVRAVFSKDVADRMLHVEYQNAPFHISGYISRPDDGRGNRTYQNFFINGRFVRSRTCMAALEEAFKGQMMVGRFPACILYLTIPLHAVDVNVHPAKLEVRFSNEKPVFDLVYYGVKSCLAGFNEFQQVKTTVTNPYEKNFSVRFHNNRSAQENIEAAKEELAEKEQLHFLQQLRPSSSPQVVQQRPTPASTLEKAELFSQRSSYSFAESVKKIENSEEESLPPSLQNDPFPSKSESSYRSFEEEKVFQPRSISNGRLIGELFKTYLLVEKGESLLLIDKHAAHERLLYERLRHQHQPWQRQVLLVPQILTLSREDHDLVAESLSQYDQLGFTLEDFGGREIIVRETPVLLVNEDIEPLILDIAGKLRQGKKNLSPDRLEDIFHSMACKAAIKAKDDSQFLDLDHLLQLLEKNQELKNCPHGRPIYMELTRHELEKQFGRLG